MNQVLTPEETAALFEGLKEAEDGPGTPYCHATQETPSRNRIFSELGRSKGWQELSTWLMILGDYVGLTYKELKAWKQKSGRHRL
jgi:hypothetical protein